MLFETKSNNKLYLLLFNAAQVNLKSLETIKYIYHHVNKGLPFKPKRNGPTQCYKCLMFGHGATQCFRYTACMLCAGNLATKNCTTHANNTNTDFKCFNCLSAKIAYNHKANDINCPFRRKYTEARNNARSKKTPNQRPRANANNIESAIKSNKQPTHSRPTYADCTRAATTSTSNSRRGSITHSLNGLNANINKNIWSIAECTNILL